jgi:hypothetical protein
MASWQGIIRIAGVPTGKVFYTGYYKNGAGNGAAGPGNGFRASQWCSGVYLTEASGQATLALSSDNFLGAGASVNAGDQLVVMLWRQSSFTPPESAGAFLSGLSRTNGLGGTHAIGFKYDNGAAATANYGDVDEFYAVTYTMTGQAWAATPGGVGGDANGDVTLVTNSGPSALITGASINQLSPTIVQRLAAVNMPNGSADTLTNRTYAFDGQTLFEQSSAAHNPAGGTQGADGSAVDGSVFRFYVGLTYGKSFGVPAGGDQNNANSSTYAGPLFRDHSHAWSTVDTFRVDLTTKDDSSAPLTATGSFYYRTNWRTLSTTFAARQYCTWTQYMANPTSANASFNAANANTILDVVKVVPSITNPDNVVGRVNSAVRGGIYSRFTGTVTMIGSGTLVINQTGIDDGLPASAPFGHLVAITQGGNDIRHVYNIVGKAANQVTIDCAGSTVAYSARDWWFTASEPGGGTDLRWNWEVSVSGGAWVKLGKASATLAAGLATGNIVAVTAIGEGVVPGWLFRVIDGPARGTYPIQSVTSDNQIVLAGAGLTTPANAGDVYEIGCNNADAIWAQTENDGLDFRISGTYTNGWPSGAAHVFETAYGPFSAVGGVNNIPPQADLSSQTTPGAATTYLFDGRKSYGTQTVWEQTGTFAAARTLNGLAAHTFTDASLNTANLREGHAWLAILNANDQITAVFPIVDLDRETPSTSTITINTLGATLVLPIGTKFKTTNAYEIEGANLDNDIQTYAWELRSVVGAQTQPTTHAEFLSRFTRLDGAGVGTTWAYTYSDSDTGRFACVELTVTDIEGATHTTWQMFTVSVAASTGTSLSRRIEWD